MQLEQLDTSAIKFTEIIGGKKINLMVGNHCISTALVKLTTPWGVDKRHPKYRVEGDETRYLSINHTIEQANVVDRMEEIVKAHAIENRLFGLTAYGKVNPGTYYTTCVRNSGRSPHLKIKITYYKDKDQYINEKTKIKNKFTCNFYRQNSINGKPSEPIAVSVNPADDNYIGKLIRNGSVVSVLCNTYVWINKHSRQFGLRFEATEIRIESSPEVPTGSILDKLLGYSSDDEACKVEDPSSDEEEPLCVNIPTKEGQRRLLAALQMKRNAMRK